MHNVEELKRQGVSIQAISNMTGFDRNMVRQYSNQAGAAPVRGPRAPHDHVAVAEG